MQHSFTSYYLDSPLAGGRIFDLFLPENITQEVAFFFVHGGGWGAGSRVEYHPVMEELNSRGHICAATDYRLATGNNGITAFDQLKDIRESYDRFVSILKSEKRPLRVAVFGTSAGAHLASLLICALPGACGEKCELQNQWVKPSFGLLQSTPVTFEPWEDIFPQIWSAMQIKAAGANYENNPEPFRKLSLVNYIGNGNPPLLFMEAENEHMFPSSMTWELKEKHKRLGIPSNWKVYKNAEHGFFYNLSRRVQREALEDICNFIAQ